MAFQTFDGHLISSKPMFWEMLLHQITPKCIKYIIDSYCIFIDLTNIMCYIIIFSLNFILIFVSVRKF